MRSQTSWRRASPPMLPTHWINPMPRSAATWPGAPVQIEARISKNDSAPPSTRQARSRFSTEQVIFAGAALVLIIGIQLPVTHYLSPKSGLGYAIGIVGGTLILAQLLYAVRKLV